MSAFRLYIIIILCQVILSANPLFTKMALHDFDPLVLAMMRFLLSGLMINILVLIKGWKILPPGKHLPMILLLAVLLAPLNQTLFLLGTDLTTPGHSGLMFSLTPLFIYILAIPILGEKFVIGKLAGIFMAIAGVIIILLDRNITLEPKFYLGDVIVLGASMAWALYTVYGKKLVAEIGAILAFAYSITLGTFIFLPVGIYNMAGFDFGLAGLSSWIGFLYITVLTTGTIVPLWFWTLKYMDASRLSIYMYIQTILAAVWSYIFYGEELTFNFIAGGIIVLAGVFLSEKVHPPKSTTSHSPSSSTA